MTRSSPSKEQIEVDRVVVSYEIREFHDSYWVHVAVDGVPHYRLGPFSTRNAADLAKTDLMGMIRATGGLDMPAGGH